MPSYDYSRYSENDLEQIALGTHVSREEYGAAKAELTRRERDHQRERDKARRKHDVDVLTVQGRYNAVQQDHEVALAREQMAHAEKLATQQITAAKSSAKATM